MLTRIEFILTETIISLRRHPTMAFAATICVAAALFVAGIVGLVILNAKFAADTALSQVRFNVYFQRETSRTEARLVYERIGKLDGVDSAEFVPKEKPWEELKIEDPKLFKSLKRNPYPDAVVVKATRVGNIPALKETLQRWADIHHVQDPMDVAGKLESFQEAVQRIGSVIGFVLAVLSLVIIHHTIELTLFARRKEIHIMSLVGATPSTVALPFLLEGIIYGLFGGAVALGFLTLLYNFAVSAVLKEYSAHLQPVAELLPNGILAILVAGVGLGLIGSTASVIKYLSRPRSKVTNA
ncbi:MAG: cell division protein FtsX [Armatimonadota bacterium]